MVRVAILTVSDRSSRGERPDTSGAVLADLVLGKGWELAAKAIVPDEAPRIQAQLIAWCNSGNVDVILTTGGTGFAPRDVTPEATMGIVDRQAPGLAEAMRAASLKITPHAMLSRAFAGIRKRTLIVNFPGSPKAAAENFETIQSVLPHAVELLQDAPNAEAGHTPRQ